MSLEQLGDIVVTSVWGREQALGSAAASIYVINAHDIRRCGARTCRKCFHAANVHAQGDAERTLERRVKAAFLFRFTEFVSWPPRRSHAPIRTS